MHSDPDGPTEYAISISWVTIDISVTQDKQLTPELVSFRVRGFTHIAMESQGENLCGDQISFRVNFWLLCLDACIQIPDVGLKKLQGNFLLEFRSGRRAVPNSSL